MSARPKTAAELAASLREIAARLDTLGDLTLTGLAPSLDLQLWGGGADRATDTVAERVAAVDALAVALGAGERHYSDTSYRLRGPGSTCAGVALSIYAPDAVTDPRDVEIAQLRAELAARGGAS